MSDTTYFDYLSNRHASETMKTMVMISEQLTPEIELAIENVTSHMQHVQDAPLLDVAVVMALGHSFVAKLKELSEKENEFDLNDNNVEKFAFQLIKSMFVK